MDAQGIQHILVIGAGTMGEGIAQIFAQAGLDVLQVDIDAQALERSHNQILSNLRMLEEYQLIAEAPETILSRVRQQTFDGMESLAGLCTGIDFVVEAVPENLDLKRRLFQALDDCPEATILSSNTSSLTISEISEGLNHPQRVVGLHFFYPAHIVPLVEIHGSPQTSADVIAVTKELMKRVEKQPIVIRKEIPGFVVNRIQAAYNREVTYLLDQGVATVEELDLAAKAGFGFRLASLGPLEIHDLNGLDIVMKAGGKTRQSICNDREHSPSLVKKVESGELGVKTGKGWHDYTGRTREEVVNASNRKLLKQLALFKALAKTSKQP